MTKTWNHFIDGKTVEAETYFSANTPCTGQAGAQVASGTAADVDAAVKAAERALPAWRDCRPIERGRILTAIAAAIRARLDDFAAIERAEGGKPLWQAKFEIEIAAQYFEFYGGLVNLYQGETIGLGAGYHSYTRREPFGVVGVITPWNAPVNQAARGIAPALAAGNTVVSKPSEFTSGTTVLLAQVAAECGLAPGVLNIVLGEGATVGAAITEHPGIRKMAFTGSIRAAREIGKVAAHRIIPLTLELGGKSPNIVFDDADFEEAVGGAVKAFVVNAGQICLAGTRLLVQKSIADRFVNALVEQLKKVEVGPGDNALVGSITTKAQYERVQEFFDIARDEGAKAVLGGAAERREEWGEGWFLPLTVYTDVTNDMRIAREEIFGPVLTVIPFEDEADAIRIANDTDYGLAAGIWTQNLGRAHRVAAAVEAGQIYVNEYSAGGVETPLGGFKQSGYGHEKGIEALHHYTQLKCVTIKL
ncbi:aldehyde dehydrogenase family protein [Lutimaribacter marinistellae]|uniref:Aldehyde dehydrogenase family protein n=1 Tax=Lutimaribacter marinistellae TaxID=1820329 RepID=A0ABV7TD97_9RHOB